jgi:hypothetical protein
VTDLERIANALRYQRMKGEEREVVELVIIVCVILILSAVFTMASR